MDAAARPAIANANADSSARTPRRYEPLVVVTLAVAGGIVFGRYAPRNVLSLSGSTHGSAWFLGWWCSCVFCLVLWWFARRRWRDRTAAWILLAASAIAGSAWHDLNWFLFDRDEIGRFAAHEPAPVCFEAIASASPERVSPPAPTPLRAIPMGERSRLLVEVLRIRDGHLWRPASGICQLSVDGQLLGIHEGDRLQVFGRISRIAPPLNPGEFDFAARARADRRLVRAQSSSPDSIAVLERGGWSLSHLLDDLRLRTRQRVRSLIGPDRAGLAAAILLGSREGLPYEETESYLVTGTVHVLVVSGMNVAILAAGLLALMQVGWVSRRAGLCLIMAVVVAYALLAESQPPVVRAAALAVLMCAAAWTGRQGTANNSLFAAGLIVLAINPNDLFGAGPQLSFLAVGALVWVSVWITHRKEKADRLDELVKASRPWPVRLARSAWTQIWIYCLVLTGVVWLTALPLVLYQFHIFSPIAVIISPVVWLFVCVAMWSGFIMLVAGWLISPIGTACGSICNASLGGLESVVRWAESVPAGHGWLPGPAWWWVAGFYVGLLMVMIWGTAFLPRRWQVAALASWILVGLVPFLTRGAMRNGLECSVVAVGHGECVLLEAPSGETMLYDAGGLSSPEFATQSIAALLWSRGIMRIDGIIISHADIDHYNAVPGLLERFHVGAIYVSPLMFRSSGDVRYDGTGVLREAIERAGVPIREIWSGDQLHLGPEVTIRVLHPPRKGVVGSDNANSITLGVEYAGRRVLLPGDLESPGLEDVIAELPYDCDVLLAPHHGSRRSDPPGFAAWSSPEWVILSGGGGEEVEPVIRTYEQAGAHVFVTQEVGAVQFEVEPNSNLHVRTWRAPSRSATNGVPRP